MKFVSNGNTFELCVCVCVCVCVCIDRWISNWVEGLSAPMHLGLKVCVRVYIYVYVQGVPLRAEPAHIFIKPHSVYSNNLYYSGCFSFFMLELSAVKWMTSLLYSNG